MSVWEIEPLGIQIMLCSWLLFFSPTVSWISSGLLSRSPSDVIKDSAVLRKESIAVWCPIIWPCKTWRLINSDKKVKKKNNPHKYVLCFYKVYVFSIAHLMIITSERSCLGLILVSWIYLSDFTITLIEVLRISAVISSPSPKYCVSWLARRQLLSVHIYPVSHYLATEKCWN